MTSDNRTTIAWNVHGIDGINVNDAKSCRLLIDGKAVDSSKITISVTSTNGTLATAANCVYSDILPAGNHTYMIVVVDSAGVSAKSVSKKVKVTVAATAPTIGDPVVGSDANGQTTVVWTVVDDADGIKLGTATVLINGRKVSVKKTSNAAGTLATYTYIDTKGLISKGVSYSITATDSQKTSATRTGTLTRLSANNTLASAVLAAKAEWLIDYDNLLGA
jgi:hypothetical protein